MAKYRIYGIFTASKFLGVFEADNEEAAIDMASMSDENGVTLCHQCSGEIELSDYSAQEFMAELDD